MKLITKTLIITLSFCLLTLSGCVTLPTESVTQQITTDELLQHVDFLTQPALKGRSAGSWESAKVRKYLSQRLEQYGCVPWGNTDSFEQDFGLGKNIIAILPGSDTVLSKEIVLISAHYDHLKAKLFSYYPGACDNAAAVAVLLEIAENLSQAEHRPKRTICFAFFDAEEMYCLGSFAFTCRDDYDDSQIVATINMDLLGRNLLDAIDSTLIVSGSEDYYPLEQHIRTACTRSNLKLLPLETNLIGPVGDHVAFVSPQRPVLFFTCGINKDYHQPTDTGEKLNFEKLKKESTVIEDTLLTIANADAAILARIPVPVDQQKVDDFSYILNQFKENQDTFKLDPNDIQTLDELISKTNQLDPNTLTDADILNLKRDTLEKVIKLLDNYDESLSQNGISFLRMSSYYAVSPELLIQTVREIVSHYLKNKPGFFKKSEYSYHSILPINENSWGLVKVDEDTYLFGFIDIEMSFETQVAIVGGSSFSFGLNHKFTACKGPLEDIVNYAFFGTANDPNKLQIEAIQTMIPRKEVQADASYDLLTRKRTLASAFLRKIEQEYPNELDIPSIQKVSDPNLFPGDPNELCNCNGIFFTLPKDPESKKAKKEDMKPFILAVSDSSQHPADRAEWIDFLTYKKSQVCLAALANLLGDKTVCTAKHSLVSDDSFPLKYHPIVKQYLSFKQEREKKYTGKTLGKIAHDALKRVTKKDFGSDKAAWKDWIEKHY